MGSSVDVCQSLGNTIDTHIHLAAQNGRPGKFLFSRIRGAGLIIIYNVEKSVLITMGFS